MARKTIWHVISNRWNSAITEYALSSARALEKQGCRNIFSAIKDSPADTRARALGLETMPVSSFSFRDLKNLRAISTKISPDRVLLYGGKETFLAKFLGKKTFVRFFGQELNANVISIPYLFSLSYSHVSKFIVPNEVLFSQLAGKISSKNMKRIYLGLDAPNLDQIETLDRNQLLILGRLDPVKGHKQFLRIFSKLLVLWPHEVPKPVLHIVGEDANLSAYDLEVFIRKIGLKLGTEVLITNKRVPNIQSLLKEACIGVIPSIGSEHICRVAEEFLQVGTPIFVSGAGATQETLFEGAGESYLGQDDDQIAQQLLSFVLRSKKEKFSERESRARLARDLFSLEAMGKNLESFIFG